MKFEILNRWSGEAQFTANIACNKNTPRSMKLRLAVEQAIKNNVSLRHADLSGANLKGVNRNGADMSYADLRYADLKGADLKGACLRCANLNGVNLNGVENLIYSICPEQGSFRAWKKLDDNMVALIEIPALAKRTSSIGSRKCRAEYVKVLKIYNDGKLVTDSVLGWKRSASYQAKSITRADKWDDDPRIECTNGIHFFMTRQEAENW